MVMLVIVVAAMLAMLMVMLLLQCFQGNSHSGLTFHGMNQLLTSQFTPGRGYNSSLCVMLPQHFHSLVQLFLGNGVGAGENDGGGGLYLVVVELTEILHIHLHLTGIHNGHRVTQLNLMPGNLLHRADHIGQLAHTGRFNDHPVGPILGDHLLQSLAEVTHQAAADAA